MFINLFFVLRVSLLFYLTLKFRIFFSRDGTGRVGNGGQEIIGELKGTLFDLIGAIRNKKAQKSDFWVIKECFFLAKYGKV